MGQETFYGYERPDGKVGVRNYVLLLPTVVCSAHVTSSIERLVRGTVHIPNQYGCAQAGEDLEITFRTLVGLAKNPNVSSVLVVALGCEGMPYEKVVKEVERTGKPVELVVIQEVGGTNKAIELGTSIARKFVEEASRARRREFGVEELVVGAECGGSDWTSGLFSNPSVGHAMDLLIQHGGRAVFSETTEIIGAEHLLARRAINEEVREKLLRIVRRLEERLIAIGVDIRGTNPTPGNIAGGLTTIEEKSLGAIHKGGTTPLVGVLEYAEEIPKRPGLYFMDTPGHDVASLVGMVAGGAQIIVFTTGRGTPTGNPIAPVLKVTGNTETYQRMADDIDINVGATVLERERGIKEAGERIFREILAVASGKLTKAEVMGHREFGILRIYQSL